MPQPVAMELECPDGFNLTGVDGCCQRFSEGNTDSSGLRSRSRIGMRRQNETRRAARTRGGMKNFQTTPWERGGYDVSQAGSLRETLSAEEFLRRFVQHVLPKGFMKIRELLFETTPAPFSAPAPPNEFASGICPIGIYPSSRR